MASKPVGEVERVRAVYADYQEAGRAARWAEDRGIHAERRRLLAGVLATLGAPERLRVLDLGCGRGDLLPELIAVGIPAANVVGVDLLADRLEEAQDAGLATVLASGASLPFADGRFELVTAFTLFSSVGDDDLLHAMQAEIDRVLAPGGSLVVYDLRLPSPWNRAVWALPQRRLRALFPGWAVTGRSCTLLPPIARRLATSAERPYRLLVSIPFLRSHRLSLLRPPGREGLGLPALPTDPTVSVILPVRNEGRFIEQSLSAVLHQSHPQRLEAIVVDGHSSDDTTRSATRLASNSAIPVTVLDNPQRIVAVSMNLGLERATGDVVIRVDGHCVIAPDYVARCLDVMRETGAECVGGPMETVGETPTAAAIAAAQSSRFGVGGVAFRTSGRPGLVDTLAFGAYRREVFERIGGFDESLVRNQDDELNFRLTRAGGRIWMDPAIRSTYFSRGTLVGLWRQYHGYGFYKVPVMRKHRTVASPRHLVPAAFVAATGASLVLAVLRRSPLPAALVLSPYTVALVVSSVSAATHEARPATIAGATATMHVAYGLGWWSGAVREIQRSVRGATAARARGDGSTHPG